MNFGKAIEVLKEGKRVSREGWNGKGMCLYFVEGTVVPVGNLRGNCALAVKASGGLEGAHQDICGHIDMIASDGSVVVGWLASQTDMMADDWCILDNGVNPTA